MTNTSGKTGIQPNNFISGLFNGDLFKKQTFSLSEVLSTSDVDAIKAYNKQIDNCVTSQTAFNRTMINTSKEAQNVVAAANGNKVALDGLTKSSKAAELGMKALAMAGNMLLIYALTSAVDIIYKCATASDRLAESAAQMGSEFASTKSDISDYKTKIEELYQTINDDTSSYEDTYNARQELLKIQDEMIDKFGDEADAVKLVTDAINGQTDSLDTLTQDKWQETVNAFNSDRGKGWTGKVADAFANIGHGNNFKRMIDEMEDTEVTFHMIPMYGDDTYEEFSKKLKEDFGADITRTERDDAITLSGDLDTIYKQLLNIQTLAKGMGIDDTFLNDLGNQADEAKSKLDEYQEMYSQHVLYDKIFNSEDYEKSFDEINKAYEKYQDAFASGDEESIEKAKQNYAEIVQSATEGLDDQSVIDYFNSMYPDLQEVVGGWEFEVKFKAAVDDDSNDFEKGVQDAVNKFDTVEDIKNYNPKVATDEQKDAYLQLKQYADEYGLTLDQLIDKLVQLGLLQSQPKSDLLNKLIPSKSSPTAGVASALTDTMDGVDADEATKWVESLTEEEAKLANSKDFENALEEQKKKLNGASLSADDYAAALQAVKDKQNENSEDTPISSTDILAQVQALSDGLDQLDKIYADVYNKEDFDWSSILNNDGFKEAFGNMTNVTEEYKNAYDDFIKTISNNPSDLSACQSAFDNLATAYIYNSDALKNVTEDTKASTIAMLEQMGIANAEEVVTAQIANNLLEARAATLDFASATDADINSLVAYANQLGLTAADVAQLCLKQIDVSNNPIKTQASLANLQSLISMAGVTGDKLTYLLKMINAVNNVASLAASGKATQSQITAAGRIVENLQGQMKNISTANVKPQVSYSGGASTKSAIDKANKSSGSSSKDSKETKETFSWVETAISRIQRAVTNLGKTVSATYKSWSTRNSALSSEMSAVTQEISVQQSAYQTYMDKANSVGLSDYYKNLVQNGGMFIEDVTDDTLKEQIQTYKEYYEKALAASDAVQDLRDNLAELAKTKFDNLAKKFENELDLIEHKSSMLDKYIDQTEKKGEIVSEHFYTTLIQNEQANVDKLQNEYNSLFNQLQDSISTGGIEVYSDDWYEMVGQINDVEEALVDANSALVDYEKSLLKLRWDNFDYLRDCISDIISETEFLADLLDNKKLFDDSGHLNNYGESLGALYAIEYNTYMNQADEYAKAIDELNKAIATNPNDKDLLDRRQELYDAQREAIKNAESEKNAIKDLISDAYDAQLEALQKLIDKRKELLDATSDLYEYENTISEKTDTIASYQKQLQAYQGDNSEEGIANRQKIQTELEKAQKDLQQTEYEKWKSDQTAMLDDLYSEYETMLNSRLDDIDALVQDVINQSNANSVEIQGTIIDVANQVGYNISNNLQTILDTNNGMYDMVAFYNENFTGLLTTTNMSINGVTDRINAMISYSDSNAVNIINSINTAANNIVTASLQAASVYSSTIASLQSQLTLATIAANNNSSNHSGGSSGSSRSSGSSNSLKPGKTGGTIKKPHRTMTSNSGGSLLNHGWNIATRYANGGNVSVRTKSPFDDLAQSMGEDTMVAVKEGERILTPVQNEMWEQWTASLPKLMDLSDSIKIPDFSKNVAQNATQSNINIGIDNIQMNGVNDPEKFTKQLVESVQQNGKVQSVLKDLTSNALLGKNSLRINKY